MKCFTWYLVPLVSLVSTASAQVDMDIMRLILELPTCTQQCAFVELQKNNCPLTDVVKCACENPAVQTDVATCIIRKCSATEQYIATKFTQEKVCYATKKPSRQHTLVTVNIILCAIAYPAVILRFIARFQVPRRMWWDDWCVIAAVIFMIPMSAISIFHAKKGFGLHFWDVPVDSIVLLRKLYYVVQVLYCMVLALAKLSIVLLYLQIFPRQKFQRRAWVVMSLVIAKVLVFVPLVLFQCMPIRSIWTQEPAKCISSRMLVFWGAGISILEDLLIIALPISELRTLKVSNRTRIGLGIVFALGSFAFVTSIVRLKYIVTFGNSVDVTWDNLDVYAWSMIEVFTAVICSCLICYRPMIIRVLPGWLRGGSTSKSKSSSPASYELKDSNQSRSLNLDEESLTATLSPENVVDAPIYPERVASRWSRTFGDHYRHTSTIMESEEEIASNTSEKEDLEIVNSI